MEVGARNGGTTYPILGTNSTRFAADQSLSFNAANNRVWPWPIRHFCGFDLAASERIKIPSQAKGMSLDFGIKRSPFNTDCPLVWIRVQGIPMIYAPAAVSTPGKQSTRLGISMDIEFRIVSTEIYERPGHTSSVVDQICARIGGERTCDQQFVIEYARVSIANQRFVVIRKRSAKRCLNLLPCPQIE